MLKTPFSDLQRHCLVYPLPFPFHSHPLYIVFNSSGRTGASCGTFCETCICAEEDGTYKKKLTGKFIHLIIYKEYYTNVS